MCLSDHHYVWSSAVHLYCLLVNHSFVLLPIHCRPTYTRLCLYLLVPPRICLFILAHRFSYSSVYKPSVHLPVLAPGCAAVMWKVAPTDCWLLRIGVVSVVDSYPRPQEYYFGTSVFIKEIADQLGHMQGVELSPSRSFGTRIQHTC